MVRLLEYNKHVNLPTSDYILESCEILPTMFRILTPKFDGNWLIVIVDPKIVEVKSLLSMETFPAHIDIQIYLGRKKLNQILLEYPTYAEKEISAYDRYKELISTMQHPLDKRAMSYVYNAIGHNLDDLKSALEMLDKNCKHETITLNDVQKEFSYTKRVYTNQVLLDFLTKSKSRYTHYETWLNELGYRYAYYSMYKQVTLLLKDKDKYLHNEDTRNYTASKADGVSVAILYILFANSNSPYQLDSIMFQFENMTTERFHNVLNDYFEGVS